MAIKRTHSKGTFVIEEYYAGAAGILPGDLIMLSNTGVAVVHDTEGDWAEAMFALEDAHQGKTVDDVYTVDNKLQAILPNKGSVANGRIAVGQNIAIGEKLMSAGDGTLISLDDSASGITTPIPIAISIDAVDLTGDGAVETLSPVRIL